MRSVNAVLVVVATALLLFSRPAVTQDLCWQLQGASIIASDGTFLGTVENEFAVESIFNEFGAFGSEYSATSIFNSFGAYGGEYSEMSPFNQYSLNGPIVVLNGQSVARLTVNEFAQGALSPYLIIECGY